MVWCSRRDWRSQARGALGGLLLLASLVALPSMAAVRSLSAIDFLPATADAPASLVLSLADRPEFKVFTLDGPPRLVVDLMGTRTGASLDPLGLATLGDTTPLRGVRIASRGDSLRVVIDLTQPLDHRVRWQDGKSGGKPRLEVHLGAPRRVAAPSPATAPSLPVAESPLAVAESRPTVAKSPPPALPTPPPALEPAPPPVRTKVPTGGRDLVVAIDAGHGGKDPGAVGARGTREKDVTLAIARRLAAAIDAEPGLRAYLVRDGDYFIDLRQRMVRARKAGADLFLSIHADSAPNRAAAGSSVYILSTRGASSEAARWLADRENAADLAGGIALDRVDPTVASVLMDLSQGDTITTSDRAARRVLEELDRIGNIHKREVQSAGFMVLKSPDIPSMLVETAFISHPAEEERLGDPDHQQRLASAIHAGVRTFFHANPPPGSRIAQLVAAGRGSTRMTASVR